MNKETEKEVWCPKQSGEFTGYQAEWLNGGKWEIIPATNDDVPYPSLAGILIMIGLKGHSQAMSFAWTFSAKAAANGNHVNVRVTQFEIVYDIKARKAMGG